MLCVGIANYTNNNEPFIINPQNRKLVNLKGCVNDVNDISDLFRRVYGFNDSHITKLLNRQATREAIIANLQRLAVQCNEGDYMVFYYSGHGSFANNDATQLNLQKGYSNFIVPADAYEGNVQDINNLELNELLAAFVQKKVHLTVIMDACYSGTNTRGSTLFDLSGVKEVDPIPARFFSLPQQKKETVVLSKNGAVVLSACQDNQESKETTVGGKTNGVFTYCLCQAISNYSHASIQELFNSTVSQLKFISAPQVPVMEADASRKNKNLPGTEPAQRSEVTYALIDTTGSYQIQGGYLNGLSPGDILMNTATNEMVKVDSVKGPERSVIKPLNATNQLTYSTIGSAFKIMRLARTPDAPVKVYLGNRVARSDNTNILQQAAAMQKNKTIHWVTPFDEIIPQATIYYNSNKGVWQVNMNGQLSPISLQNADKDAAFLKLANKAVYLELPCPDDITGAVKIQIDSSYNKNIGVQTTADNANYILAGVLHNGVPQYGWMNMQWQSAKSAKIPFRTDFFGDDKTSTPTAYSVQDSLFDRLVKLGKLAGWLTLQSPVSETTLNFPYTLRLRNKQKALIADGEQAGSVTVGDTLLLHFEENKNSSATSDGSRLFIYVFSIDPNGNMMLLFPGERTSIFNYPLTSGNTWLATIRNTTPGMYHYFLLSCTDRILNTDVFSQQGVITRAGDYYTNPLEALIHDGGSYGRDVMRTPANWLLKRVDVETVASTIPKIKN